LCCESGSNRKTQPCYWLAMNNHTRRKHNRIDLDTQKMTAVKNIDQMGFQEAHHLHRTIWNAPNDEFPKRNFI
jgi:hypothetical protein